MNKENMATSFESVSISSVDEDGRLSRLSQTPLRIEVSRTQSDASIKAFNGTFVSFVYCHDQWDFPRNRFIMAMFFLFERCS